ncbi:MAG TPA: methylisocitrate lyase [Kiritimatiellia bacterium]|nr:methylisocitrate lyase [Kiritimatiellia bacterium]HMP33663.1 methylisocitrate lyase [Kiritimatiellia bacterium]
MVTRHGQRFRDALAAERPLQVAGAINAYTARLAERAGFHALYVSGAGVANASFGLPDLGFTTLDQVAEDVRRIAGTTSLPLLVDIDTGWEDDLFTGRTMKVMYEAGAAAVHLEDQVSMKRCGHRPGKALVSTDEMVERVEAAAVSKPDPAMVLMARTDAAAVEGVPAAIARAQAYVAAGADMIFAEALTTLDEYRAFIAAVNVPVLANITEFGKTPLFTVEELRGAGIAMVLYPLSAFRAMSAAARDVYAAIRRDGSQRAVVDRMQSRTELYEVLDYLAYEKKADDALNKQP